MARTPDNQTWQVSAFTRVCWRSGAIEITSSTSPVTLRTTTTHILDIMHSFASPTAITDVINTRSHLSRREVIDCIDTLVDAGVLVPQSHEVHTAWEPTALAYHQISRGQPHTNRAAHPQRSHQDSHRPVITLAPPSPPPHRDFADVLAHRRSTRAWPQTPIAGSKFSTLLWMSAGTRPTSAASARRPYPSGGGIYSLEIYPVIGPGAVDSLDAGVYRYRPDQHAVEQLAAGAENSQPFLTAGAEAVGNDQIPVLLVVSSRIAHQSATTTRSVTAWCSKKWAACSKTSTW